MVFFLLKYLVLFGWICAVILLILKIFWKPLDRLTIYGKLKQESPQSRQRAPFIISILQNEWISRGFAFQFSYAIGLITNSVLLSCMILSLCTFNYPSTAVKNQDDWLQFIKTVQVVSLELLPFSILLEIQLIRRLFESFYVHKFTEKKLSNFAAFLSNSIFISQCINLSLFPTKQ